MDQYVIKHLSFRHINNRNIAFVQLYKNDVCIMHTSLAEVLTWVNNNDIEIVNAQELLDLIVLHNGFAA